MTKLVASCAAALFLPLVVALATNRVFTLDDLALFHVPTRYLYAQALSAGDAISWTPSLASGFYLHGEGQVGMLHPLHLLLYSALPFAAAFNLDIIFNYGFALAGGVLLLRRFGMSAPAAWLGGLLIAFSGFNLMHLLHVNAIAVAAHLPWLMLTAELVVMAKSGIERMAGAIGVALVLGSAFLMGFPQCVLLSAIAVAAYVLWRLARAAAHDGRRRHVAPTLAWLAAAAVGGAGLGAVQLLPTMDVAAASVRNDVSTGFALSYSLHPFNLVQLVAPYAIRGRAFVATGELAIHESAVYGGAFGTLAIAWALLRRRDLPHRPIVGWALGVCAASLVLALGRYGGFYYALASLPVFGWFRAPARFIFLFHFGMAIVAAAVFDDLLALVRAPQRRSWGMLAGPAVLVLSSAAIALAGYALTGRGIVRGVQSAALMFGTGVLMLLAAHGRRVGIRVLPAFVALDLGLWGYGYLLSAPMAPLTEIARLADVPPGEPGELLSGPQSNLPVLRGYRVLNAYVALTPAGILDIESPIAQRLAGAAWRKDRDGWTRVALPSPRVRLVFDWRESHDVPRDLGGVDPARTALVVGPIPPGDRAAQGTARVVEDRPGRLVVQVEASGRGLLVTTERFHEGWRAVSDDGRALAVVRANGGFLGCVVESGSSRVHLTFAPWSLRLGSWISGATLLAVALLAAVAFLRRISREE